MQAATQPDCGGEIGCCAPTCLVSDAAIDLSCAAVDLAATCVAWFAEGMAPPGYEDLGVCSLAEP